MSLRAKHVIWAALFACAIMVSSATASAQVLFRGTMELANQTRWSQAVLQPGTYEVTVEQLLREGRVIHISGHGYQAAILAGSSESAKSATNGKLEIVQVNGMDVVRRFDAGSLGVSFAFHVPKAARTEAMHRTTITDIPVDATH